jgi:hypothetical protein
VCVCVYGGRYVWFVKILILFLILQGRYHPAIQLLLQSCLSFLLGVQSIPKASQCHPPPGPTLRRISVALFLGGDHRCLG